MSRTEVHLRGGSQGIPQHLDELVQEPRDPVGQLGGAWMRSQVRGAIIEEVTALLLARRVGAAAVHRERRILFDGVRAEIHPYDVTVERDGAAEAYDCKWGARGINADVLHQLDDARANAAGEDEVLGVALVVFDARRSCDVRLAHQTAPHESTRVVTIETLDGLAEPAP